MKTIAKTAVFCFAALASGGVLAQQGIGIGNVATDTSGFVGSLRTGKSNLTCAAGKLLVGARHTDRAFAAPNSADGITTDYDPRCATVTTDGATVTVTNDAGFTDYSGYDQPGTVNQNTCGANQVVGRVGGFDRDIAGVWLSSVQHVCYAMTLDANDWVERSTTIAATQNIGVNEANATHTLRGPFCTNNADTIGVGIVSQNGGEGYDGMQAQCAQFVQARFSAALNFTDFAWNTTLGGAGWTAQLSHTSGNMAVRTPRPAGVNNLAQFESANELYVIPGAGYSATPIAPAGIAANTYVVTTACTNANPADEQDLACPLAVTGRPDIAVTLSTPATAYSIYGQLQNIVLTATNVGPGATDGDDGFTAVATLPAGWTAGTLPANCTASGGNTIVTCVLNPTPLAGSSAPGNNGGTVSFTIPVTVNSPTSSGTYTANAALGRSVPDADADATNNDYNTANDTASGPLVFQLQPSFGTCDSRMWVAQNIPTQMTVISTGTNPFTYTPVGSASATTYNAVGYNPADTYMYAMAGSSNQLLRLGADGSVVDLGAVSGLPVDAYFSGAFRTAGNTLYVLTLPATQMYAINVITRTATAIALSRSVNAPDLAFVNGLFYGMEQTGQLVSINPSTGQVTNVGVPNTVTAGTFMGALFGAPNGLFGILNSGGFYQIDLVTGAVTLISAAPSSTANDGAHCPAANITFGADLQVTKTNTPASGPNDLANDSYTPGTARTYTVVVTNAGPFGAANAVFADPAIANFTVSSVTCGSPTGGGVCPTVANTTVALMQGSGIVIPSLPYSSTTSSSVTFTVTGTIAAGATGALSNVATVAAGEGTSDTTPANNSAADTDTPTGTIVIVKDAVPNDAQDFAFTTAGTGLSAFSLDDDADGTLPNTRTFTGLEPGSYTVTEAITAGWSLTALSCSDPDSGTVADLANRVATVDIDSGETVTCTYSNSRLPILRLQKALPLGRFVAADQFDLSIAGSGGPANVTTAGAGSTVTGVATLNPGAIGAAYAFAETAAAGANLANYTTTYACTNALAGGQAPSGSGTTFNVTAAAGDDLTCTFSNTRNPIADLTITKTNTPASGASDQANDTLVRGATTTYTIVVSNNGPDAVTGAILTDPPGSRQGLTCTAPPTCAGSACPAGLTLAQLESGVPLGALANGVSITVTLSCIVN